MIVLGCAVFLFMPCIVKAMCLNEFNSNIRVNYEFNF